MDGVDPSGLQILPNPELWNIRPEQYNIDLTPMKMIGGEFKADIRFENGWGAYSASQYSTVRTATYLASIRILKADIMLNEFDNDLFSYGPSGQIQGGQGVAALLKSKDVYRRYLDLVVGKLKSPSTVIVFDKSPYRDLVRGVTGPAYVAPSLTLTSTTTLGNPISLTSQFWPRGLETQAMVLVHEFARTFLDIGPESAETTGSIDDVYAWKSVVAYLSDTYDALFSRSRCSIRGRFEVIRIAS